LWQDIAMSTHVSGYPSLPISSRGDPTTEVAALFPLQGSWSEEEFLALDTNRMIELADGRLEVLPKPTPFHQFIARYISDEFRAHLRSAGISGSVLVAPLPVRLFQDTIREPDVMFFRPGRISDVRTRPDGVDLAVEIVSPGAENRERDLITKRREYAKASVEEYWIVDDEIGAVTVLVLRGSTYAERGVFTRGQRVTSVLLKGLAILVDDVFAAGEGLGA
jgi:Uma2 family endonuclease